MDISREPNTTSPFGVMAGEETMKSPAMVEQAAADDADAADADGDDDAVNVTTI